MKTLDKILLAIIAGLVLVLITGTIVGLSRKKQQTPQKLISEGKAVSLMAPADTTDVTYYEGGSEYNVAEIDDHMNSDVFGISSDISDKKYSYIRIMLLCD